MRREREKNRNIVFFFIFFFRFSFINVRESIKAQAFNVLWTSSEYTSTFMVVVIDTQSHFVSGFIDCYEFLYFDVSMHLKRNDSENKTKRRRDCNWHWMERVECAHASILTQAKTDTEWSLQLCTRPCISMVLFLSIHILLLFNVQTAFVDCGFRILVKPKAREKELTPPKGWNRVCKCMAICCQRFRMNFHPRILTCRHTTI